MKKNDTLQTPEWVYKKLGEFYLDPCAGLNTNIAKINWSIERGENGLERKWIGTVFCNPPFSEKEKWIDKMITHGQGILLLPERGSAPWFMRVAVASDGYFVMGKKINFVGGSSSNNIGSVLFAFGQGARRRIMLSGLPGHLVDVYFWRGRDGR